MIIWTCNLFNSKLSKWWNQLSVPVFPLFTSRIISGPLDLTQNCHLQDNPVAAWRMRKRRNFCWSWRIIWDYHAVLLEQSHPCFSNNKLFTTFTQTGIIVHNYDRTVLSCIPNVTYGTIVHKSILINIFSKVYLILLPEKNRKQLFIKNNEVAITVTFVPALLTNIGWSQEWR